MVTAQMIGDALRLVHFRKEKNKVIARLLSKDNNRIEECYNCKSNTHKGKQKFVDSMGREQILVIPMGL